MSLHEEGLLHHLHHHSTYSSIFLTRLSHHPCKRRSSFPDVVNQAPSCSALFPLIVFFGSILFNRCVHMLSWHLARWPAHLYFFVFISCMMSLAFVFFRKTSFLWPRLTSTMTLSVTFSVTQVSFPNSAILYAFCMITAGVWNWYTFKLCFVIVINFVDTERCKFCFGLKLGYYTTHS